MSRKERKRSLVKACLLAGWKKMKLNEWPSFSLNSLKEYEEKLERAICIGSCRRNHGNIPIKEYKK